MRTLSNQAFEVVEGFGRGRKVGIEVIRKSEQGVGEGGRVKSLFSSSPYKHRQPLYSDTSLLTGVLPEVL